MKRRITTYTITLREALCQGHSVGIRLWLGMRYLDHMGSGRIDKETQTLIQKKKTKQIGKEKNQYFIVGKRRFNDTINEYDGIFWTLDRKKGNIYLHDDARVASALGIEHLGNIVEIDDRAIFEDLQTFKAICYSALLVDIAGKPVSRAVLRDLANINIDTQHTYEKLIDIKVERNVGSDGLVWDRNDLDRYYWDYGRSVFNLRGIVTWRLPNSYKVETSNKSARTKRKIDNKRLTVLNSKVKGNGHTHVYNRKYHYSYPRSPKETGYVKGERPILLPDVTQKTKLVSATLWLVI